MKVRLYFPLLLIRISVWRVWEPLPSEVRRFRSGVGLFWDPEDRLSESFGFGWLEGRKGGSVKELGFSHGVGTEGESPGQLRGLVRRPASIPRISASLVLLRGCGSHRP